MEIKQLSSLLQRCGVVGAGGAGFPSYAKLSENADTIILNCAECEPILQLHRQVLEQNAFEIAFALDAVRGAVGADRAIIALKKSYKGAVEAVKSAITEYKNIEISYLPEIYPSGDEVVTIYEATGRVVPPGGLPIQVGVTVFNAETMLNIYNAINADAPVTHKYVTLAGEVKNPKTVYAPIGMSFKELIALAGGITAEDYAIINGGPMMGAECGIYDTVTRTTNALLVLPREHYIINRKRVSVRIDTKRAMSACCQCRMCTDLCPRNLLGHPIVPSDFMHSASSGRIRSVEPMLNTMYCSGCGLCELYSCGQGLSPRSMIAEYKAGLRKAGVKPESPKVKPVSKARRYRGVSKERLTARIGLSKYDVPAPISEEQVTAKKYRIKLSQHIGAPAQAVVKLGDAVAKGQVIGKFADNALSVSIHTPADGKVTAVTDNYIEIKGGSK